MRHRFYAAAGFSLALMLVALPAYAQGTPNPFSGVGQQPASPSTPKKGRSANALKPGQFTTEAEAKARCPGEPVVWANTSTKVYHKASASTYGKTKRGAYMCEKDTAAAGIRAAKNEK